jgi:hypothetical protein
MMTLDTLCGAVPSEMMPMITKKDMAKKAWDDHNHEGQRQLCEEGDNAAAASVVQPHHIQ